VPIHRLPPHLQAMARMFFSGKTVPRRDGFHSGHPHTPPARQGRLWCRPELVALILGKGRKSNGPKIALRERFKMIKNYWGFLKRKQTPSSCGADQYLPWPGSAQHGPRLEATG